MDHGNPSVATIQSPRPHFSPGSPHLVAELLVVVLKVHWTGREAHQHCIDGSADRAEKNAGQRKAQNDTLAKGNHSVTFRRYNEVFDPRNQMRKAPGGPTNHQTGQEQDIRNKVV